MRKILLVITGMLFSVALYSQSVGLGSSDFTPNASAALEIRSNNKGLLISRMSSSDKNAISSPSKGLLIYQIDLQTGFYYYNGSKWELLGTNLNDKDFDPTNEIQVLSIVNDLISLSNGGGSIKLPAGTIGAQTLTFTGTALSIANGNSVDLSILKDDMGDHKAGQNIILLSHFISGDGDDEGISISSNGDVIFSNAVTVKGDITLKAGSINNSELADASVSSAKLLDGSVVTSKLSTFSVTDTKLADNSVSTNKLQANSVISDKILDNSITSDKINNGSVNSLKLSDGSVITSKLSDGSITSDKIGDGQVLGSKLSSMNASTDSYLKWDGAVWVPSSIGGVLNYKGVWSAQSNIPVVSDATGIIGDFYVVSSVGNQDLGAGSQLFSPGDWILFNGIEWERVNNSNEVNTVFGRKGIITAQSGDYTWGQIDKTTSFLSDLSEVMTSTPDAGHILIGNGTHWESSNIHGDLTIDSNGNAVVKSKRITYDKLQDAVGSNGTILLWTGVKWEEVNISSLVTDELQDIELSSANLLGLTKSNITVDLSKYIDNTDSQDLSLLGNELKLSNDASSVDLSKYLDDTDEQNLTLIGTVLSIEDGNSVDFSNLANSVKQDLSITGNTLSLSSDATTVDLSKYLDNTDSQSLNLSSSNVISISNSSNNISLSKYLDNTDNQELRLSGNVLSISGGINTLDLSGILTGDDQDLSLIGDDLTLTNDNTSVNLGKYLQDLSLIGSSILISNGTGVDVSSLLNIQLSGNLLGLSGSSNTVNLSALKDNLGNHKATEKLQLSANKIGFGTEDKGLSFDSNGHAYFTNDVNISVLRATDAILGAGVIGETELAAASVSLSKLKGLQAGKIIIGTDGTNGGNAVVSISGDAIIDKTGNLIIQDDAVTSQKIAGNSVISSHIANLSLQSEDLSDGIINSSKLSDNSVISNKLLDGSVITNKLGDGSVTSAKLSNMSAITDDVLRWNGTSWLPSPIAGTLDYQGTWNPASNNPTLDNSDSGISGNYYVASQSGSIDLGEGNLDFYSGDIALGTSDGWRKISSSNNVSSVFGRTGAITAQSGDYTWAQVDKSSSSLNDINDVSSSDKTSGNILISDGSNWIGKSVTGDLTIGSNGLVSINTGSINSNKLANNSVETSKLQSNSVIYSKIQNATGGNNTVLVWNGASWVESLITNIEGDASVTNELQTLNLTGNDLSLSLNSSTVNLSKYLDNTDTQNLSLVGTQLSISGGNNIDLSGFASTDSQELALTGNTLTLTRSAASVDLSNYAQTLSLNGSSNVLTISDGNNVDLSSYLDNTDSQDLTLTGNMLSLTNDATTIDLSSYLDNTDAQNLSITNHSLSLSGGNTIDLSVADIQDLSLSADVLSLTNDVSTIDLSPYRQTLSLTSTSLAISGGNSIDISSIDTDDQTIGLTGTNLAISSGNTIDLVSLKDNLGNHIATTNIQLGSHYLSNDGTAKGILISSIGDVNINKKLDVNEDLSTQSNLLVIGDVGIGGNLEASSALTVNSNSKGVLISRITTAQRNIISAPATGLMIYNTSTNVFNYYNGTSWESVGGNDNLGNHTATENVQLNGKYLSNDGGNEGITVDDAGNTTISGNTIISGHATISGHTIVSGNTTISGNTNISGTASIGSGIIETSAAFEVESSTKGMLLPRMTTAQRAAINSPAKGLIVFDNTLNSLFAYNGTIWEAVGGSDNLGDHTATENIQLNGKHLSNDGDAEGISIGNGGTVLMSKDLLVEEVLYVGGVSGIDFSAALGVGSTTKGFLPPRMTTTQKEAINSPAKGLMVFDNTLNSLSTYNGTIWEAVGGSDNLGNHTATTNIQLNGHRISNDGDTEGIAVDDAGDVGISGNTFINKSVLIGSGGLIASAILELESTTKGFLPPRMTTTQKEAINSPAIGLVVFDTDDNRLYVFTGTWTKVGGGDTIPVGTINAFAGTVIPTDWILCNGASFNAATYPELQTVLGSSNLPDLRGVFLRGLDSGRGLDTGRTLRSYQSHALQAHRHQYLLDQGGSVPGPNNVGASLASGVGLAIIGNVTGANTANETRPVNVAVNYIIKAK